MIMKFLLQGSQPNLTYYYGLINFLFPGQLEQVKEIVTMEIK